MAKIIKCAKCGACTTACPVYRITNRESLTARGRIHLLGKLTGSKHSEAYNEIFSKCLMCGACYQTCPRGINTPELIAEARAKGAVPGGFSRFQKLLIKKSLEHPSILPSLGKTAKAAQHFLDQLLPTNSGLRKKLGLLDPIDTTKKSGFVSSLSKNVPENDKKVAYFPGCMANYLAQDIGRASVRCLDYFCQTKAVAPSTPGCCGMAAYAAGDQKQAVQLAKNNIAAFNDPLFASLPIFTSCATCYSHLKSYPQLFKDEPAWQAKAISFSERVCEFSTFILANLRTATPSAMISAGKKNVIYHDPCHLRFPGEYAKKIINEPRTLIGLLPGVTLKEPPNGPQCCGQGGLFNIAHPQTSDEICTKLLADLYKENPETVVTTCTGCLIQLQKRLLNDNSSTKATHLAIFIAEYIDQDKPLA